jgi:Tripartite tricarboxylate transporter TctB family
MQVKAILDGRVAIALVMLLIFISMSLLALGLPEQARLMPLLVGIPGTLLGLAQLVLEIRGAAHSVPEDGAQAAETRKAERGMYVWVLLFFLGILGFGFIYGAPLLVFAFLFIGRRESLLTAVIGGAGTWALMFGGFETGFEIPLFGGLVLERLFG